MRIGIIGWYGHDNAGDERMLYCIRRFFEGHELVAFEFKHAVRQLEELNRCDWVLLGGGSLVLRGTGVYGELIRRMRPRFGCIGLGVATRHPDNRALVEALKDRAEFILVRDARSKALLDNHAKVVTGPDLTFLYPYDAVEPANDDVCGVNLRPWHYWEAEFGGGADRLMRQLGRFASAIQPFYPLAKWSPRRAVAEIRRHFRKSVAIPLHIESPKIWNDWWVLSSFFPDAPRAFSPQAFDTCRCIVGMRFHSIVFACQKGIPFVSLTYQPKNDLFCKALGMEDLSVDLYRLGKLPAAIERLKASHAELRERLLDYSADSHREIVARMSEIRNVMT